MFQKKWVETHDWLYKIKSMGKSITQEILSKQSLNFFGFFVLIYCFKFLCLSFACYYASMRTDATQADWFFNKIFIRTFLFFINIFTINITWIQAVGEKDTLSNSVIPVQPQASLESSSRCGKNYTNFSSSYTTICSAA